ANQLNSQKNKINNEIKAIDTLQETSKEEVHIIMLDNFKPEWIAQHIQDVPSHIKTEASGNINIDNVLEYAQTGVHYISIGSLFYNQQALDISAKVVI